MKRKTLDLRKKKYLKRIEIFEKLCHKERTEDNDGTEEDKVNAEE